MFLRYLVRFKLNLKVSCCHSFSGPAIKRGLNQLSNDVSCDVLKPDGTAISKQKHEDKFIVCTPRHLSGGGGLNLQPNFQKGGLDKTWTFRVGLLGKRGWLFSGGVAICRFKGGFARKRGWCFWGGVDTPMHNVNLIVTWSMKDIEEQLC